MLKILRAGLLTTVQDLGRLGFRRLGISQGGALDVPSMKLANLLVDNPVDTACLEITLGQLSVEFSRDGWIALTGADCSAELDGQTVWSGWRIPVSAGQKLTLKYPQRGMRSYLAVDGGINLPEMLGSHSTDLKAGFGGLAGRALKDHDILPLGEPNRSLTAKKGIRQLLFDNRIRVLTGPEYDEFTPQAQQTFWRSGWQLNPQSNRMGYRLNGVKLERTTSREMLSHGLIPGIIQVPHNGQPIILMADAQTTGGYPRIACVIEADMYHLAQIRLGEPIHFVCCTLPEAQQAKYEQERFLQQVERGLYGDRS